MTAQDIINEYATTPADQLARDVAQSGLTAADFDPSWQANLEASWTYWGIPYPISWGGATQADSSSPSQTVTPPVVQSSITSASSMPSWLILLAAGGLIWYFTRKK